MLFCCFCGVFLFRGFFVVLLDQGDDLFVFFDVGDLAGGFIWQIDAVGGGDDAIVKFHGFFTGRRHIDINHGVTDPDCQDGLLLRFGRELDHPVMVFSFLQFHGGSGIGNACYAADIRACGQVAQQVRQQDFGIPQHLKAGVEILEVHSIGDDKVREIFRNKRQGIICQFEIGDFRNLITMNMIKVNVIAADLLIEYHIHLETGSIIFLIHIFQTDIKYLIESFSYNSLFSRSVFSSFLRFICLFCCLFILLFCCWFFCLFCWLCFWLVGGFQFGLSCFRCCGFSDALLNQRNDFLMLADVLDAASSVVGKIHAVGRRDNGIAEVHGLLAGSGDFNLDHLVGSFDCQDRFLFSIGNDLDQAVVPVCLSQFNGRASAGNAGNIADRSTGFQHFQELREQDFRIAQHLVAAAHIFKFYSIRNDEI